MAVNEVILLFLNLGFGAMLKHEQPVTLLSWREHCKKDSIVLNDCNWCRCNPKRQYVCAARVCNEVDMFGHFNDAIKEINVGMEGHGVWRTTETACEPGVFYRRDDIVCVCNENGNWPNPVCRDIFQILHSVEVIDSKSRSCSPTKLYLVGCNVCFCPSNGVLNPELCTKKKCTVSDPAVEANNPKFEETGDIQEMYAQCEIDKKYQLGCRTCICLRNNRLHCDNCTLNSNSEDFCYNRKPGDVFRRDCNFCYCNANGFIYCSTKRCIPKESNSILDPKLFDIDLKVVEKPYKDELCTPLTRYKKACNSCYCVERNAVKIFGCTMNKCSEKNDLSDCVVGTMYEMDCLICNCVLENDFKMQICMIDERCSGNKIYKSQDLSSLHGYCEPLHVYKQGCNSCRCLSDGKTIVCTAKNCAKPPVPLTVDLVPVLQKNKGLCPKGHSYKVDCNLCFCLSNGNAICTAADCNKGLQ